MNGPFKCGALSWRAALHHTLGLQPARATEDQTAPHEATLGGSINRWFGVEAGDVYLRRALTTGVSNPGGRVAR
jgi:hypothetical protein